MMTRNLEALYFCLHIIVILQLYKKLSSVHNMQVMLVNLEEVSPSHDLNTPDMYLENFVIPKFNRTIIMMNCFLRMPTPKLRCTDMNENV